MPEFTINFEEYPCMRLPLVVKVKAIIYPGDISYVIPILVTQE